MHMETLRQQKFTQMHTGKMTNFRFLRSMELYDQAMNSNETMLLDLETFKVFDQFMGLNDR